MNIIILGAGQVGTTVAEHLVNEANDITLVDQRSELLKPLQDRLDLRTVVGHASHPEVLRKAGIEDADLLLAVTSSDETNMMACQIAYTLFNTPTRLARVRSADYQSHPRLFAPGAVPVDFLISPEKLVTTFIRHLIRQPGALQILDFADGKLQLVAVRADIGGPMVGRQLRERLKQLTRAKLRIVAIYRRDRAITPTGETVIEANDEIFFIAKRNDISTILSAFRPFDKPYRRIVIAGGGNIGKRLAELLESDYRVKVIESNPDRCRFLAESLHRTIVLHGEAGEATLLESEDIDATDVFCALTNDDETNVLSAMLAKRLGARKTMAIINRTSYVDLVQGTALDIAISPAQVTIGALLAHIRRGDVVAVHSLRRGAAEAIEIIAHGDAETSRVVGRRISDLNLPPGTMVGAIARADKVIFAEKDTVIEAEDHVILFLADKASVAQVERLFQVAITFI
ncbi:Trk system potassium transporter TrkA [Kineobactrum sediminis]|uniref:Trk system potassium uptake protein TrkA n=1 Tax=Kineobactrum sediminis TaxID=1905677 RepID=A0A2N5Y0U9_9GAMM|nr:Trk system potassium transporter TrkA [Kineobactrum sediminis]PLW82018.1 Trk system potassium transporter TrkA [Kineobactrum sediminis]